MLASMRLGGRRHSWAWRIATAIALMAQCWVAAASLADARGLGASAHVEQAGTSKHFAHDEASCAACTLLALNAAVVPRWPNRIPSALTKSSPGSAVCDTAPAAREPLSNPSRAPPSDC